MGYRDGGGVVGVLAAVALVIVFASALSWARIALGLVLRPPTAVMNLGFVLLFSLTFLSDVFVAPATILDWLRHVANTNPISHLVTAARADGRHRCEPRRAHPARNLDRARPRARAPHRGAVPTAAVAPSRPGAHHSPPKTS